jgi:hypothetical protein
MNILQAIRAVPDNNIGYSNRNAETILKAKLALLTAA